MSTLKRSSSQDSALEESFGAPAERLHATVAGGGGTNALRRAMELREALAIAEEQVRRVREQLHQATAPDADLDALTADQLAFDAQWLQAAHTARTGYITALTQLLHTIPNTGTGPRPARLNQPRITAISTATASPSGSTGPGRGSQS